MTQNPEIEPGTPAPLSSTEVTDLAALDQGTYSQLRTCLLYTSPSPRD